MKYISILSLVFVLFSQPALADDGIKFFKGTFEEAKALAAKEHKIIFVDAYTSWCGPCKRMARDVFTQEKVGDFYNKHFINLKVDMEKGEGPKLAQKYSVRSYPTFLFLDDKGEVVHQAKGGRPADQFIGAAKLALNKNDKSAEYAEKYDEGKKDPVFLRAYAYALMNSAKPSHKIANEYLRTQKDFSDTKNLEFLFDFSTEADSKIFETMVAHKEAIIKLKGEEAYQELVLDACNATVNKAVEFKVEQLVDEAKDKMKDANPDFAREYKFIADMKYAMAKEDIEAYLNVTHKYLRKFAKKDGAKWNKHAKNVLLHTTKKEHLEAAEKWAKKAVELDYQSEHLRVHAAILQKLGQTDQAMELVEKAKKIGGKTPSKNTIH